MGKHGVLKLSVFPKLKFINITYQKVTGGYFLVVITES